MQFIGRMHLRTYPDYGLIKTEAIRIDAATEAEAHDKLTAELVRRNQQAGTQPAQLWYAAKDAIQRSKPGSIIPLVRSRRNSQKELNPISMDADLLARHQAITTDEALADLIASAPFQRLWDVSFLGAIAYAPGKPEGVAKLRSRADHSLSVAALADLVAETRGYSAELRRHLVAAALLHDIGHPPLSHSVEPYFKERLGIGHHELAEQLIAGREPGTGTFTDALRSQFDTGFITSLIAGKANKEDGGDLFSAPVNIDTIDGIWRSFTAGTGKAPQLTRSAVAQAAFIDVHSSSLLDEFWHLKHRAYNEIIHSPAGLAADECAEAYFQALNSAPQHQWMLATETEWQTTFADLFQALAALPTAMQAEAANKIDPATIDPAPGQEPAQTQRQETEAPRWHKARTYWVDTSESGAARYKVSKAVSSPSAKLPCNKN